MIDKVKFLVVGSGLFLTFGELTINDIYIILLVIALALSIIASLVKMIGWLVKKIKEAKADDGKVSREERKAILKAAKEMFKQEYANIKSDTELVKEKVESKLAEKKEISAAPVPIEEEK